MKLIQGVGEVRCPECKCALDVIQQTAERAVLRHTDRSYSEKGLCSQVNKLFSVVPPQLEAVEV
jgi:hypothetical protein